MSLIQIEGVRRAGLLRKMNNKMNNDIKREAQREDLNRLLTFFESECKIKKTDIMSVSRKIEFISVRAIIYKILKDSGYSYNDIAYLFNKDHATIINGIKTYNSIEFVKFIHFNNYRVQFVFDRAQAYFDKPTEIIYPKEPMLIYPEPNEFLFI